MAPGDGLIPDVAHFQRRVIQEALDHASRSFWLRRAAEFDAVGTQSAAETAQACRNRAALAPLDDWPELDEVLTERGWADGVA